ncbi:Helix-turn-helix domain-containing protein [Lachnospiraceae bacterium XBB2008]|nr:Helix-turn-helix domain-containing protein [Lachnospiraceae bacterium XBB2008]
MDVRKFRVIIAEDEKLIAKNIAKHIEEENPCFKVCGIYSNGEDALEAVRQQPPDVVFTDISMPVMTGLELASEIYHTMNNVKCVIITGYADFEYAKEALHYGVTDYLLKPVDREELHKVLKELELSLTGLYDNARTDGGQEQSLSPEEIVRLVEDYVQANYAGDLDLNTIAQNLGFSSSYLTKVFNKVENTTPSKYIRNYRMGIAKQLMNDKKMTLQQIAAAVGYNDPFHFSRSFKQTIGMTPSEYRDSLK